MIESRLKDTGGFFEAPKFAITSCTFAGTAKAQPSLEDEGDGGLSWLNPFASSDDDDNGASLASSSPADSGGSGSGGGNSGGGAKDKWALTWTFSGNWRLPYRPRVRLSGDCIVTTTTGAATATAAVSATTTMVEANGAAGDLLPAAMVVTAVEDRWTAPASLPSLLQQQVAPRLIDLLNVYSSPHTEAVPWSSELLQGGGGNSYQVFEAPPHVVLKCSWDLDPSVEEDGLSLQVCVLRMEGWGCV